MRNTIKLFNTSSKDLFSRAGWIMINKYIEEEMRKPENAEWFDKATFADVLDKALSFEYKFKEVK